MNSNISLPPKRRVLHQKKSKKTLRLIFFFFLLVAIISFFNSSISRIIDIEVIGLRLLSEKTIYDQAGLAKNMHYFFTRTSSIENKLLMLEQIKEVKATKEFPGKLRIHIVEQKPVALFYNSANKWEMILENGYLYNYDNKKIFLELPLVTKWQDLDLLPRLGAELDKVNLSILNEISEIHQNPQKADSNQLLLYSKDGYKIHISLNDLGDKLNLYPLIIESLQTKNDNPGDIYLLDSMRFEEFGQDIGQDSVQENG